jgi:hypothetical protein
MASPVTVRVFVVNEQLPTPDPIVGVLVRVFDSTGTTFITQDLTDANGIADFTLDGDDPPIDYQIRLSKLGVAFDGLLGDDSKSPQLIQVYYPVTGAPSGTNDFVVKGQTYHRPVATDPRLCRASGFFRRGDGQPYPWLDLMFVPAFKPTIVDGDGVMAGTITGRTDEQGYFEIDLYRTGIYHVSMEGLENEPREVTVPDWSSINIIDLLFPVVGSVVFDPTSVTVASGEFVEVLTEVRASDGRLLDGAAPSDVLYTSNDLEVAAVQVKSDRIVIQGLEVGSTTVAVDRADKSVMLIPDTGISYTPLPITVT